MAKFKDNSSGLVYEFSLAYDVEQMRKHPDYTEVKEELIPVPMKEPKEPAKQKG